MSAPPLRIAELCLSSSLGGLELYVFRLTELLRERSHQCVPVVTPGSRLDEVVHQAGFRPLYLAPRVRRAPLLTAYRLARWLTRNEIGILHLHRGDDLELAAIAKFLCRRRIRLVYSRHIDLPFPKRDVYHRMLYRAIDAFVAVTDLMAAQARQHLPLDSAKVRRIYLGARTAAASALRCNDFYARNDIDPGAFKVALIGRMEPYKGQHDFIAALPPLVAAGINVQGLLIGRAMEESYRRELETLISRLGLGARVKMLGHVPNPEAMMHCFDVVALTTVKETFGLVLIEAMRAGVAVIGSAAGGVPEIIEDGVSGMLFAPGDVSGLTERLATLYRDRPLRQRLALAGRQRAEAVFSEERHMDEITRLFSDLVA